MSPLDNAATSADIEGREGSFYKFVLCGFCTRQRRYDFLLLIKKEVSHMELKELVLEVEELEQKIAPAMGSVGGH